MAKKSEIAKNEKRQEIVARYAARRAELKDIIRRPSSTDAERAAARRNCAGSRATPAPPAYATGTVGTAAPAVVCAPSASSG
jgi:hypothetical protein